VAFQSSKNFNVIKYNSLQIIFKSPFSLWFIKNFRIWQYGDKRIQNADCLTLGICGSEITNLWYNMTKRSLFLESCENLGFNDIFHIYQLYVTLSLSLSWAPETHTCSPSYSGGRDQDDCGSKPAPGQIVLKQTHHKKRAGGVAQVVTYLPLSSNPSAAKRKKQFVSFS
jgi:hypothetical protein